MSTIISPMSEKLALFMIGNPSCLECLAEDDDDSNVDKSLEHGYHLRNYYSAYW